MRRLTAKILLLSALLGVSTPAHAIDPLYQKEFARLVEIMGSLYFLDPLCHDEERYWRYQAEELILLDQPDDDRKARLFGSFNDGYAAYARTYTSCTPSALVALDNLLEEADGLSQEIHTRFSE